MGFLGLMICCFVLFITCRFWIDFRFVTLVFRCGCGKGRGGYYECVCVIWFWNGFLVG